MKIDEQTGLYGNYGVWHKPFWQTTTFYVGISLIVFVFFLLIGFFLLKKYRMRRKKQLIPAWKCALQQLELLRKENKISSIHGREFYLAVTAILKNYLQERFKLRLKDKTDTEVTTYLKNVLAVDQILLKNIQKIFQGSITIKFANERALQDQIERDFCNSVTIIKKTMQREKDDQKLKNDL